MFTLKNKFRALKGLAGAAVLLSLSACATTSGGKFACPAPDGFRCMNPVEVYEATNHTSNLDEPQNKKGRKSEPAQTIVVQPVVQQPTGVAAVGPDRCCNPVLTGLSVGQNDSLSLARPTSAIAPSQRDADALNRGDRTAATQVAGGDAYRESAKIMRIFVAPWEDERGDLHMGGVIYSEIEPRKWRIGQRVPDASNTFSLLRGQAAAADDEVASNEPVTGTTSNNFNPQR